MSAVEEGLDLYSEMRRSPVGRASLISISLDPEQPTSFGNGYMVRSNVECFVYTLLGILG